MGSNLHLNKFEDEVFTRVRHGADQVLSSHAASLKLDISAASGVPLAIAELNPENPASAPMKLQIDDPTLLTFYLGRYATVVECFSSRTEDLFASVDAYVSAAIDGRYEEWVPATAGNDQALGIVKRGTQTVRIRYNTLRPFWLAKRTWQHVRYEPYKN